MIFLCLICLFKFSKFKFIIKKALVFIARANTFLAYFHIPRTQFKYTSECYFLQPHRRPFMIKPNFEFQKRFGNIFRLITGDDQLVYVSRKGKLYSIPENISEEELENLMRLSVEQKKNLVLKLVKGHELKLDPDVIY